MEQHTQRMTPPPDAPNESRTGERGQALVEYVLIVVLLAVGFGFALAITGPAIGNVFNNVLFQVVGQDPNAPVNLFSEPGQGGSPDQFWATVTWVAQVRQTETPFPTPVTRPTLPGGPGGSGGTATPSRTPTLTPSMTPSNTNTPTPTLTPSMTPTNTLTPSPGPSPTPPDKVFNVPHVDQMGNPAWWRLGRSSQVEELANGTWDTLYYDSIANYTSATAFTLSNQLSGNPTLASPTWTNGGIGEYWGGGRPAGLTNNDTFGAIYSKSVNLISPITMTINLRVDSGDAARFFINGTLVASRYNQTSTQIVNNFTLPAGAHDFVVEYADNTGNALIELNFSNLQRYNSPDDNRAGCTWDILNETDSPPDNNTVSTAWMFAQDPTSIFGNGAGYAASQTCYLEMRGYVDVNGVNRPTLSFWDYWQLPANVTATLQVGRYTEVTPGANPPALDRALLGWQPIAMRTGGTTNYNWTRNALDLSGYVATLGDKLTFRFVLQNTSGSTTSGVHRWFLDDLQVLEMEDTTPGVNEYFTVNDTWNFDTRDQMGDFVFDADSLYTLESEPSAPGQLNGSNQWRWNLTSNRPRGSGGMSWDDSPGFNHITRMHSSSTSPRISFLEFRYPIDLRTSVAPTTDVTGNSGRPLLTFYTVYNVGWNTSIQVEYTNTSPNTSTTLRNWQIVPSDGRIRRSTGCTTCDVNEQSAQDITASGYRQITVRLDQIPNWSTTPFYLRFSLIESGGGSAEGWYIDDMSILREAGSAFITYPFTDDVENPGFTTVAWSFLNGWASTTERGSYANAGSLSYADSPGGNYASGSNRWMEMKQWIDLNYDTLDNINNPGTLGEPTRASGAAVNPMLTFMHQRSTESGATFFVDINIASNPGTWYTIWRYDDSNTHGESNRSRTQNAWERVEIDLAAGLQTALGSTYTALTSDANLLNDDIRIRFRMAAGGTPANGVFVDDIRVENRVEYTHRLWGAAPFGTAVTGAGDGVYEDLIEFASRTGNASVQWNPLTSGVQDRWYLGSGWSSATDGAAYYRSAPRALTDTSPPGTQYEFNTENFLEMRPIIDLRGTDASLRPLLTFWARYDIGDDDRLRVQIATEEVGDLTQAHDNMAGWSRWEPNRMLSPNPYQFPAAPIAYWHRVNDATVNGSVERRDTWQFYQVDLSSFAATASVAGKRIRVRFMLDSDHDTTMTPARGDGWYIDNVSVRFGHPPISFVSGVWEDNGGNVNNWIMEGSWGTTPQNSALGSGTEALGVGTWRGMLFDCETINDAPPLSSIYSDGECTSGDAYDDIMDEIPNPPGNGPYAAGIVGPYNVSAISYNSGGNAFPPADFGQVPPNANFSDTYAARFTRTVTLTAGTYTFQTFSDDGVRLRVSDPTNIVGLLPDNYIIDNWNDHSIAQDREEIQVTADVTVTLTLEYYERSGNMVLIFGVAKDDLAYTDSPNTPNAVNSFDTVNSIRYGNSSLMLNGYFDLSSGAPNRRLSYQRAWDLLNQQNFYLDISTDGGFTWTAQGSETLSPGGSGWFDMLPYEARSVTLPAAANVMFRFRMETISGNTTNDGIYIDNISVTQ